MVVHTLLYRFSSDIDKGDISDFFSGLKVLSAESGLVDDFAWQQHLFLPADERSMGMTATHIAQFSCRDISTLRKFSESAPVHEFVSKWRQKINYDAAYANHETLLLGEAKGDGMFHTEHTVTVDANADVVFEVLADVLGYAELFPPTKSVTMLEETETHQIARLVVDVSGQTQSWVSRRDLDRPNRTISYRQLETAAIVKHMGGEWRSLPLGDKRTQLVITHDFAAQPTEKVTSQEEATRLLRAAVEKNSHADLAAVRDESEKRARTVGSRA